MICSRCKNNHTEDTKMCELCKIKNREWDKKRYAKDPEKFRERKRKEREENIDKFRERARERYAEDPEKFREYDRKYHAEDPEKKRERNRLRNATPLGKYQDIKKGAIRRNIPFDITEDFVRIITNEECFYCGQRTSDILRNGIDRLDNTIGYVEDNCVSCCGTCNNMKKCLDAHTFVERCSQVSLHNGHNGNMCVFWNDVKGKSYSSYKSKMKNKDFQLTKEQYVTLCQENCTYCGRMCTETHTNGIDRVDNTRGYILDNCVSCCGSCNIAKGTLNVEEFINKCVLISCKEHDIPKMPRCINIFTRNRPS
ncbi:hypothetical protein PBCV1_A490L [Paramecium bursaria Chlorella virus 1]|uniref:HNH endonuclease n=2 Tax=Chlorovirus TaxID=181083 RepID=Q98540_PBCV1|nr:hypothetical protein PBCV1_A490L [Paramecium bursaria Chlorella virus 1]AAC96857.1 hypothetical protein [Paramecium bursaria Chlorella virus 1]AGE53966.1 hypothetical protein PBCVIL3A_546L [Paramecium bursaria Chlorella virus IL3A]